MSGEKNVLSQLGQLLAILIPMLLGFIWLDSNHDKAGSGHLAEVRSMLYYEQRQMTYLSGVLEMYDNKEALGVITDEERARKKVVIRDREEVMAEVARLKTLEAGLLSSGM